MNQHLYAISYGVKNIKKKYKNITSVVKYKRRKNDKIRIKNHKMAFHTKYEQIMKNG